MLDDHALALVAGKRTCGKAALLVEDLFQTDAAGVLRRVDKVTHQHADIAWLLSLENLVENQLEVGIAGITDTGGALVDVAVFQELIDRVLIGINAVIDDIDVNLAAGREMVDQVVDGFLQLSASAPLVVGDHRSAALKVDCQRQVVHAAIGPRVPVHGGTQL